MNSIRSIADEVRDWKELLEAVKDNAEVLASAAPPAGGARPPRSNADRAGKPDGSPAMAILIPWLKQVVEPIQEYEGP